MTVRDRGPIALQIGVDIGELRTVPVAALMHDQAVAHKEETTSAKAVRASWSPALKFSTKASTVLRVLTPDNLRRGGGPSA
jgi:hypothetical protein